MRPCRSPTPLVLALVVAALLGGPAGVAASELELYRPRSRTPEELVPIAASLLGPHGSAVADPGGRALVLRGDPDDLAHALEVLEQLDVPPRSWRVESSLVRESELAEWGLSLEGWVELGDLRLGRLSGPAQAGEGSRITLGAHGLEASGERGFSALVTVLDGRPALVQSGRLHPERQRTLRVGPRSRRLRETVTWLPALSGLAVTPRGRPDGSVELEIAAGVAERQADGTIEQAGSATRVRVRPGETVVLAGLDEADAAADLDPLGSVGERDARARTVILVRVSLVD